jgi:hypothetical protein
VNRRSAVGGEVAVFVADGHRPEPVDGHLVDSEPIGGSAVVVRRIDVEVQGFRFRVAAPRGCRADQPSDRVGVVLGAEYSLGLGQGGGELNQLVADGLLADRVPLGDVETASVVLLHRDGGLQRMDLVEIGGIVRVNPESELVVCCCRWGRRSSCMASM